MEQQTWDQGAKNKSNGRKHGGYYSYEGSMKQTEKEIVQQDMVQNIERLILKAERSADEECEDLIQSFHARPFWRRGPIRKQEVARDIMKRRIRQVEDVDYYQHKLNQINTPSSAI